MPSMLHVVNSRHLMIGGTTLFAFSLFMLSLTKPHHYYQVRLTFFMRVSMQLIFKHSYT